MISQRAYALHRGCSRSTVQAAIAEGRLRESLKKNAKGAWQIIDAKLADAEWAKTTRPNAATRNKSAKAQRRLPVDQIDYAEARRRKEIESLKSAKLAAEAAELEMAERRGDMVSTVEVKAQLVTEYAHVRTALLGLASRCQQRLQHLTTDDVAVIDSLVREALEGLADGLAPE